MRHKALVLVGSTAVAFALSAFTAPSSLVSEASGASIKASPHCLGKPATIVGTRAAETIHGTAGHDVIVGGGGNDHIFGMGGADRICDRTAESSYLYGGAGADRIAGGGVMAGGPGNDVLLAPPVSVTAMHGGRGDDLMRSHARVIAMFDPGPGDDTVESRPGALDSIADFRTAAHGVVVDLRTGTADADGHDVLHGINYVYGSRHDDVLLGDAHGNQILRGDDVIAGRGGRDTLGGEYGNDRVDGGAGPDLIAGEAGRDVLRGDAGNDNLIEQKPDANVIVGGPGRRDRCYGGYQVPPNLERGCELHKPPPHHPRQLAIFKDPTRRWLTEHLFAMSSSVKTAADSSVTARPSCHIQLGS